MSRKHRFALAFVATLFLLLSAAVAHATENAVAKAAAWRIGDDLSLAGLLYAQGGEEDAVKELLARIKPLTDAMQIELKPFPQKSAMPIETYASIIEFLIKGDGAAIGRQMAQKFGQPVGTLFEISVKSNLLILLYEPGNDQGIADVISSRCNEVGLPHNLWLDVVNAVKGQASKEEVKNAVFKMHDDVETYLNQQVQ